MGTLPWTDQDRAVGCPRWEQDLVQPGPTSPWLCSPLGPCPLAAGSQGEVWRGHALQRPWEGLWPEPPGPAAHACPRLWPGSRSWEQRRLVAGAGSLPFLQEGPGAGQGARVRIRPPASTCRGVARGWRDRLRMPPVPRCCHRQPQDTGTPRTPLSMGTQGSVLHLPLQRQSTGAGVAGGSPGGDPSRVPIPAMSPSPVSPFPPSAMAPWPPPAMSPFLSFTMSQAPRRELSWAQGWWGQDWPWQGHPKLPLAAVAPGTEPWQAP